MADALVSLGQSTSLQETQAWLRQEVTGAVLQALHDLQHPPDCSTARKLLCNLNKNCGFGCQIHHVVHCFAQAVALNRTMVLYNVYPSNYIKAPTGWEEVLQPVTSCGEANEADAQSLPKLNVKEPKEHSDADAIVVDVIDNGASSYDPPAMPWDVLEAVQLFKSRPQIWWVGVLTSYLLRPSSASLARHAAFRASQQWGSPIVGVHIRRTDKLDMEAKLHQPEEYMTHVERLCDQRLPSGWQERAMQEQQQQEAAGSHAQHSECSIYLASDEPAVAAEVRQAYRHIHVITNDNGLQTSSTKQRYSSGGFAGIYDDIMHLAACDIIVGTFSSQVSRMAYEVAMVNNTLGAADRAFNYHSVDSMWYYGGQVGYTKCAASDYTDKGVAIVKAGQELHCPTVHEFNAAGYMQCNLSGSGLDVVLPPQLVVDCGSTLLSSSRTFRPILPEGMRRPAAAAQAAEEQAEVPHVAATTVASADH
uniref:GT23 domain-containing protein n=1 Tax=Tetradesmus obliquus TaxID=3088 RepID=A0A383W6Q5_TETOB|eukprot:jgi/Sobl393_1/8863/SZX73337.1